MIEIVILLVLVVLNGIFAMSEIAVVSSRKPRLRQLADEGVRNAQAALDLAENPNRFLSTVQVGITLVGVLAGAYGGVALADDLAPWIAQMPPLAPYSTEIAFGVVVIAITYLSLVVGELAPKHIALQRPEHVAMLIARPMRALSAVAAPLVSLLSGSTDLVLRILGRHKQEEVSVTEEEISFLLAEGTQAGVFEAVEHEMIERIFRFGDQSVAAIMTPRPDIECLRLDEGPDRLRDIVASHPHTRFVVCRNNLDDPVGIVHVKDLLAQILREGRIELEPLLRQPPFVPESSSALRVLEQFKRTGEHLAIVVDEYGGVSGLVTLDDVLEAIIGDIPWSGEAVQPNAVQREDGSWLVEGMMPIDEFKDLFDLRALPEEDTDHYYTVGGFVVSFLGHIPAAAEHFVWNDFRIEVVDMDRNRIDKVLVVPPTPQVRTADESASKLEA